MAKHPTRCQVVGCSLHVVMPTVLELGWVGWLEVDLCSFHCGEAVEVVDRAVDALLTWWAAACTW